MAFRKVRYLMFVAASMLAASAVQANIRIVVPPPKVDPVPIPQPKPSSDPVKAPEQSDIEKSIDAAATVNGVTGTVFDGLSVAGSHSDEIVQQTGKISEGFGAMGLAFTTQQMTNSLYRKDYPAVVQQSTDLMMDATAAALCAKAGRYALHCGAAYGAARLSNEALKSWSGKGAGDHAYDAFQSANEMLFPIDPTAFGSASVELAYKKQAIRQRMSLMRDQNQTLLDQQQVYISPYNQDYNDGADLMFWNTFIQDLNAKMANQYQSPPPSETVPSRSSSTPTSSGSSCSANSDDDPSTVCVSN